MEAALPGLWSLAPFPALLGVLVFLILALSRGWIIPKSSHEREVAIYKGIVENKDKTIESLQAQNTSLLEVGRTVQAVLRSAGPSVDESTRGA